MLLNVSLFQNMELELEKCRTSEDAAKIDVERLTMTKDGLKKKLIECKGKLEAAITSRQQVMQVLVIDLPPKFVDKGWTLQEK